MTTSSSSTAAFDVIVVGSGAGGSAATYRLVRSGLRVLLIEKGKPVPMDGSTLDVQKVVHEGVFKSKERWADAAGRPFVPEEYFNVGGKTKWYGAALARFSPVEFVADPTYQYLGWPCGYEDMRPYYEEIEALLGIRRFGTEPALGAIIERLRRNATGWRTESLPLGLDALIAAVPEEAKHFDGFASAAGLKSDGEQSLLRRVADAANLVVSTGQAIVALIGDDAEPTRIAGVRLEDGTALYAKEVVLAAGALHSPRLLQRYIEAAQLQALPVANVVGRNFKLHLLTAVLAISASPKRDLIRKTTLMLNDRVPHSSVQPLGFDGELISTLIPRYVPRPLARAIGARAYGFFLQTEDGSSPDNRVLAQNAHRADPVLDYDPGRAPGARDEHRALVKTFCRDLRRGGYIALSNPIGLHGTAHACGTMRAGDDPHDSVVDAMGRVHGFEGLSVADGGILPRSSRVNPALTIYAWGLRVADAIAARVRDNTELGAVAERDSGATSTATVLG